MVRPTDWYVLDMDSDPTPGDPDRLRLLADRFHDFAEHAHRAKLAVDSLQGDGSVLTWIGKSGDAFREQFGEFPGQVDKLYRSHLMVGDALETFAPILENAQAQADRALSDGRVAADKLKSLQGSLNIAETDFTGASQAAERARNETQAPDPDQVKQAVRDSEAAQQKRDAARTAVAGAQGELDLAKQLANQAKELRDGAARTCAREIDDASDAGIQPRSFWEKLADAFKELWNIICEVAKWVALVAGIIAMIIGGPLAWVALAAGAILLIKAVVDFANGKGSVMDLVFGILGVIPGVKGLTSLSKLSALYKAGGLKEIGKAALTGMKDMAKAMVDVVKGLGSGAITLVKNLGGLANLGAAKLSDLFHVKVPPVPKDVSRSIDIRECVTDPIDVATGEMVLTEVDLELPGPLAFTLERTHLSSYRGGSLFGKQWASTLDQRIETDSKATLFFAADAMVLVYPIGAAGVAVLPEAGPRWPLTIAADGSARLDTGERVLGFDAAGRLATIADPAGSTLRVERDADGLPRALHHPTGRRVHFTARDGQITAITLAAAGSGRQTAIAGFEYDGDGRLTEVSNISGVPGKFRYDHEGRITQWIDRTGYGYRYTYDEDGRCVGTVGEDGYLSATLSYSAEGTAFTDSLGHTTTYTFDEFHHKTSVTDPLGNTTRFVWGPGNQLLQEIDPLGHVVDHPAGVGTEPAAVAAGRDTTRLLRGGRPENPDRVPGLAGWVAVSGGETIAYDPEGYPIERTGTAGGVWRGEYGPFGILLASTDAEGARTTYTYDTELRVTSVTDPRGLVWRYAYDPAGRVVTETDFNGRTLHSTYDAAGHLIAVTDGLGETVTYERDALGRMTERRTSTGVTTYRYDEAGHLVSALGPDAELTFTWDAAGRRIAETVNGRTLRLEVDEDAGTVTRHTPAGVVSAWESDPFGRPYALRGGGHELVLGHDASGRETGRAIDGRPVLAQAHDDAGRLLGQHLPAVGTRDFEHRVDGVTSAVTDWTGRREFRLDGTGRITGVQGAGRDETYHYPRGRRDGEYDGTMLLDGDGVTYAYDERGRASRRTVAGVGTWHFAWNADDQLVEARTPDGDVWRYRYDPLARRISKVRTTGPVTVERYDFTWSGSTLVEQAHTDADGTLRVTTWDHHPGDGRPVARTVRVGADLDYATVITDQVGTPTELLGADGALRWQNTATIWGATDSPAAVQPLAFPGQYRDDETGLHYNVFRYYDPLTGRYLSQDPLGLAPSIDPGDYVGNPLMWADPLGLACTGLDGLPIMDKLTPADIADMQNAAGDLSVISNFKQPGTVIKDLRPNASTEKWLYHGSDIPPDKIFKEGLVSNAIFKNGTPHYDIKLHQQNSSKMRGDNEYSGFVSTTTDMDAALHFVRDKGIVHDLHMIPKDGVELVKNIGGKNYNMHFGYIYVIKGDGMQPFIDLNSQIGHDVSKISQKEFAALDHIPGFNISHAFKIDSPYNVVVKDGVQQIEVPPGVGLNMDILENPGFAYKD